MNYPNIAICSYNLNWKIMDLHPDLIEQYSYSSNELKLFKSNIISNIQTIYDYYNPQIYCFQETSKYQDFIHIFNKEIFKYHINSSGPEFMVTVWDSTRIKLLESIDGEFESGRPFCIFIFKDLLVKNIFILINIHAGHNPNTLYTIFKPIQQIFSKSKIFSNYPISRIIIGGDFNRDINQEIKSDSNSNSKSKSKSKLVLKLGNRIFNFQFTPKSTSNTCCSISGNKFNKNFDFVIDTFDSCILRHELNKESWYKQPASDHIMVMTILQQGKF